MKLFAAELQQREQQLLKQVLHLQPHSCGWDGRHQRCEHGWRQYQLQLRTSYRQWSAPYGVLVRVRDWRVLPCPPEGVVVRWKGTCPSGKAGALIRSGLRTMGPKDQRPSKTTKQAPWLWV